MKVWEEFLRTIEQELGEQTVSFWLRPLKVALLKEGYLQLVANDSFQVLWFEEHVRPLVEARLIDQEGRHWKAEITCIEPSAESAKSSKLRAGKKTAVLSHAKLEIQADPIDKQASFEWIHEYEGCRLAKRALAALAQDPASFITDGFNPLYVYGPSGCGKSSLLMACAKQLQISGKRVLYVRGETFTHHVVQAIRLGMMQEFRRFYRGVDVFILDGIEILSHKAATQEEFFHTFNSLHVEAHSIIVSAKVPPKDLKGIEPRLISRFEWGLMTPIEPPLAKDLELILAMHAKRLDLKLPQLQGRWLIEQFGSSTSLLIRALATLALRSHRQRVQLATLQPSDLLTLLQDLKNEQKASSLSSEKIVQIISDYYGITTKDLLGKCQRREFSQPRQMAMYLCREKLQMSFLKIALMFGRDHSTVMASCKLITQQSHEKSSRVNQELPLILQKL